MKFVSSYPSLGFYDEKKQLQQFENGEFETKNKKVIEILKNLKECSLKEEAEKDLNADKET